MTCCGSSSVPTYRLFLVDEDGHEVDHGQKVTRIDKAMKAVGLQKFKAGDFGQFRVISEHGTGRDEHGVLLVSPLGYEYPFTPPV